MDFEGEKENEMLKTPHKKIKCEAMQTPRRSTRKSVKPIQDYAEIVGARKLVLLNQNVDDHQIPNDVEAEPQPKWTPAKVGRVSQKRGKKSKGKKSKRAASHLKFNETEDEDNIKRNQVKIEPKQLDLEKEPLKTDVEDAEATNEKYSKKSKNVAFHKVETDSSNEGENQSMLPKSTKKFMQDSLVKTVVETSDKEMPLCDDKLDNEQNGPFNASCCVNVLSNKSSTQKNVSEEIVLQSNDSFDTDERTLISPQPIAKATDTKPVMKLKAIVVDQDQTDDLDNLNSIKSQDELQNTENDINANTAKVEISDEKMQSNEKLDNENDALNDTFDTSDCVFLTDDISSQKETEKADSVKETVLKSNDSLDTSDCILISPTPDADATETKPNDCTVVPILQTDDKIKDNIKPTSAKTVRILINDKENLVTPLSHRRSQPLRNPTPYKTNSKINVKINDTESLKKFPPTPIRKGLLTSLDVKQIVTRSNRKRSLSVCIGSNNMSEAKGKRAKGVTFYSPANQTALIDDLDVMIAKSVTKNVNIENNITKRRKRSISVDDRMLRPASKLPRPVAMIRTPSKQTPQKTTAICRVEMPNFAAIHQKNFTKMENLVDHVARKAERAKLLTTSSTKKKPSSRQNISPNAHSVYKFTGNAQNAASTSQKKPALKPVQLSLAAKPLFNLSTSLKPIGKPQETAAMDKVALRRNRHMEMFKGRNANATRQHEIIQGVRSNRRFELQMLHRKNLENN